MEDGFLNIDFNTSTLDKYYVRSSILRALKENTDVLKGNVLDIGCGKMPYRQLILNNPLVETYRGLDLDSAKYDPSINPDYTWNGIEMPFSDATYDCALATEVLEHCPEPLTVAKEIYRVLRPDGIFFFTVPYLWTLHEVPHDEYRYTPFALERIMKEAGFANVEIKSLGGWNASLAQMLGLWVRRSPMKKRNRKLLSFFLRPLIKNLIKRDTVHHSFYEGQMITGLYGICKK